MLICITVVYNWFDNIRLSSVSTSIKLHHLDSNETHGKNVKWELHQDTEYYLEQSLEVTLSKTAVKLLKAK